MSATSTLADLNESVLEMITSVQDRIVDAHREVAGRAAGVVPSVPSVPFATPGAETTRELAEQVHDFQVKVLEANKRFTLSLLDAWSSVLGDEAAGE